MITESVDSSVNGSPSGNRTNGSFLRLVNNLGSRKEQTSRSLMQSGGDSVKEFDLHRRLQKAHTQTLDSQASSHRESRRSSIKKHRRQKARRADNPAERTFVSNGCLLNKTDLILAQKDVEKLTRQALLMVKERMPTKEEESAIVEEWCHAVARALMAPLAFPMVKTFARKVRDFLQERKNADAGIGHSEHMFRQSHHELEMVRSQE